MRMLFFVVFAVVSRYYWWIISIWKKKSVSLTFLRCRFMQLYESIHLWFSVVWGNAFYFILDCSNTYIDFKSCHWWTTNSWILMGIFHEKTNYKEAKIFICHIKNDRETFCRKNSCQETLLSKFAINLHLNKQSDDICTCKSKQSQSFFSVV